MTEPQNFSRSISETAPIDVSVVVPAYNVASYIDQTIESICAQSLASLEILVVDDASSDETPRIIARHAARDARVRLLRLRRNGGVCLARNMALAMARGRWIAFVDSDDWLAPQRLARLMNAAEAAALDWIADDQIILREPGAPAMGRVLRHESSGTSSIEISHLVDRDPPERIGYGTLKPLVRRAFLERHGLGFRIGQERYEDFLFHVDCGRHGARMGLLDSPLYYYRQRPGSLTSADPVTTLVRMLEQNEIALRAAKTQDATGPLIAALARRALLIREALAYRRLLHDIRRRDLASAARRLQAAPAVGLTLVGRLGRAAGRRLGW